MAVLVSRSECYSLVDDDADDDELTFEIEPTRRLVSERQSIVSNAAAPATEMEVRRTLLARTCG